MKILNKIIITLFIFFICLIIAIGIIGIIIVDNALKWREYYEYIDIKGEKGRAPYCYILDKQKYCRNTISSFKVNTYIEKKERR